jgi:hypothetical protein
MDPFRDMNPDSPIPNIQLIRSNRCRALSRLELIALLAIVLAFSTVMVAQQAPEWLRGVLQGPTTEFEGVPEQDGLATIETVTVQREGQDTSAVVPSVCVRFEGYVYPVARAKDWMKFSPGAKCRIKYRSTHTGQILVESVEPY